MSEKTPTTSSKGEPTAVTIPTAPTAPPDVPGAELTAATTALEYAEDCDTREVARVALEAAAWVRAHPERAGEAPTLALAGLDRRVVWFPLVADAAATGVAVWGVLTGRLGELLDSTRWPHLAWLLAGAIALALLVSAAEDIHRCYRAARQTRQTRQARRARLAEAGRAGTTGEEMS